MNWRIILLPAALLSFLLQPAFSQETKAGASKPELLELANGKIIATKPEAWKSVPVKSAMLQHEFRFPAEGEKSARITIMTATGGIASNIDRWIGQFDGVKKEDAKIDKKQVDQTTVHTVEITGTYKESMGGGGPFAPAGPMKKLENHKMLGAILELKDGTTVFVKATGPSDIVAPMRDGFVKMLDGIKNK
jgi:hypothetical protein